MSLFSHDRAGNMGWMLCAVKGGANGQAGVKDMLLNFLAIFGSILDHIFIYCFANATVKQEKRDQKIGSCVKPVFHGKH